MAKSHANPSGATLEHIQLESMATVFTTKATAFLSNFCSEKQPLNLWQKDCVSLNFACCIDATNSNVRERQVAVNVLDGVAFLSQSGHRQPRRTNQCWSRA